MATLRTKHTASHLILPLSVLGLLIVINLIKGADYFSISVINGALYGNIPNILFGASELVIISIGMTLVTASSGGQDISVGVAATIASAVFGQVLIASNQDTVMTIVLALLASCGTGLLIVVSVIMDFVQRIEANLLMRNYAGFLGGSDGERGPRLRGPRS